VSYPFYLGESLVATAASHDLTAFSNLVERNFSVIINTHAQSATVKKFRLAGLVSLITRAVYRAGGNPDRAFDLSMDCYEEIGKLRIDERDKLASVLQTFCHAAFELIPKTSFRPPNLLQRFLQELEQDKEQLSVETVARKLNVSTSYLCRVIKVATGRTPSEYIRLAKLSQARSLLATTTVTNAAMESGFSKVSAFIELFRKHYGETPGIYKRRLMCGGPSKSGD